MLQHPAGGNAYAPTNVQANAKSSVVHSEERALTAGGATHGDAADHGLHVWPQSKFTPSKANIVCGTFTWHDDGARCAQRCNDLSKDG
jgi:hypothetical protein